MITRSGRAVMGAALVAFLVGCNDGATAIWHMPAGTYDLVAIKGDSLPALGRSVGFHDLRSVSAGTLTLSGGGFVRVEKERVCTGFFGVGQTVCQDQTTRESGDISFKGDTAFLGRSDSPAGFYFVPNSSGSTKLVICPINSLNCSFAYEYVRR
jgi:hypothetical protein